MALQLTPQQATPIKVIVGLVGPSTGGKSSLVNALVASNPNFYGRASFADYLKEVAAERGWNGEKDSEGRKFLQATSEDLKREHGESVFYDVGIMRALQRPETVVVFDDARFFVEIVPLRDNKSQVFDSIVLGIAEPNAERKWFDAVCANEEWARHRSECEWRSMLSMIPVFTNDKSLGLDVVGPRFCEWLTGHVDDLFL